MVKRREDELDVKGRGSENRAVVYMPGCAAGLLYSGPEQVPKRNTASRPRLASSLGRTRSTGLGETEGRGPDLGFGDAVILLTGMDSGAPDGAGLPEPETLNQQLAGIDVSRALKVRFSVSAILMSTRLARQAPTGAWRLPFP
ncbi:unnamed protein product, partial [Prorocentrum cordatum]